MRDIRTIPFSNRCTRLLLMTAALVSSGCVDTESKCRAAYEQAYSVAYDESYDRTYSPAYAAAYATAEPTAYEAQRKRLVASGEFSYDPLWLALAVAAGAVLGFAARFLVIDLARRTPPYAGSLDRQMAGIARPRFGLPRPSAVSLTTVALLCACLAAAACGDGGAARCGVEGEAAGRLAGERDGQADGERDGQRRGTEEGTLRATIDAQEGNLPEIYVTPGLIAAALGIGVGIWAQRRVFAALLQGKQVPVVFLAMTVPGITRSRIFRAWRAEQAAEVERRLRPIGGAPQRFLSPPAG